MIDFQLKQIKKIGSVVGEKLAQKEIFTVKDLVEFFPRRYEDRSTLLPIDQALEKTYQQTNFIATVVGQCVSSHSFRFKNRRIKVYTFHDGQHAFYISAFNPAFSFSQDQYYLLSGKLKKNRFKIEMTLHEYEKFDEEAVASLNLGRIVPIYPRIENLSQKKIRHYIRDIILSLDEKEYTYSLPPLLIQKYQFPSKKKSLEQIHFPESMEALKRYKHPFIYEEFFNLQTIMLERKKKESSHKEVNRYTETNILMPIIESLPFQLSEDQKKVLKEILNDLKSKQVMRRMLQGDVGTGKTIIALLAMTFCYYSGHQSAIMAPTEILANQHYRYFTKILHPFDIEVRLLTGQQSKKAREKILLDLAEEDQLVVIGTHALIQKEIHFKKLKLIIIDEQHRFGVEQRKTLQQKGERPDLLSMSATPIPRSLFISFFGDLDASVIKKRPLQPRLDASNQTPNDIKTPNSIRTKLLMENDRNHAYHFIMDRVRLQEQGYIVFPLINESNNKKLRSLIEEYHQLKKQVFKETPTAFLHGKISVEEKEMTMNQFYQGKIKILLATTVLEVGIDHPNATTIIIESAHQFGLSQLHQLRGRVGRGNKSGYCYLISDAQQSIETHERLSRFCKLQDGFEISELDLKIRGPGDMIGVKQSGIPPLKIGHLINDFKILKQAREDASQITSS